MRIQIDRNADAAYIRLSETAIAESEQVQSGIVLDFDASGEVVGIELLEVSQHMPQAILNKVVVETA
jgi:uncharacterized protein YuzE